MPGKTVLESASGTMDFQSSKAAQASPLARALFSVDGVNGVFFGADFLAVNVKEDADWLVVKPHVFAAITEFYASGKPTMDPKMQSSSAPADSARAEDDEATAMIKELIESRIRPSVQEDGGDVVFKQFKDGVVYLQMQGSCVGCPSSAVTLKNGIENMLTHYVPEVQKVEEWVDVEMNEASAEQLKKLEQKLQQAQQSA